MTENIGSEEFDINRIYDYKEFPDKKSGRCDNCNSAHFMSSIENGKFVRECRKCGMKKSI